MFIIHYRHGHHRKCYRETCSDEAVTIVACEANPKCFQLWLIWARPQSTFWNIDAYFCEALMTQVGTNMLHRATNDLTLRSHPQPVSDHSRRSIRLHGKLFSLSACSLLVSLRSQHPFDIFSHCFDSFPEVDRPPPPNQSRLQIMVAGVKTHLYLSPKPH